MQLDVQLGIETGVFSSSLEPSYWSIGMVANDDGSETERSRKHLESIRMDILRKGPWG
jgi:hypothetical protein